MSIIITNAEIDFGFSEAKPFQEGDVAHASVAHPDKPSTRMLHDVWEDFETFELVKIFERTENVRGEVWKELKTGNGGASFRYVVIHRNIATGEALSMLLQFQQGHMEHLGLNGFLSDLFLYVCMDRQVDFNKGKFASEYNTASIAGIQAALDASEARVRDRQRRGVMGLQKA